MTPNDQQQSILDSKSRFNLIFGNAGSAKTTTLAMKVMDALHSGMRPHELLCLTYSAPAVRAFQQRLRWLGLSAEEVMAIPALTFAQFCHRQLLDLEGPCHYFEQPNRRVHDAVLRGIDLAADRAAQRGFGEHFEIAGEGTLVAPELLHAFRPLKGRLAIESLGNEFLLTPESASDVGLDFTQAAALRAYEQVRFGQDDIEAKTDGSIAPIFRLQDDPFYDMALVLNAVDPVFTAETHPLMLGIKMLFVDEGHDLNLAMFTVLQHLVLANPIDQLFLVGDADQVVHSDSGADPSFMKSAFTQGIGKPKEHDLTLCRRFGENLAVPLSVHAAKRYDHLEDVETRVDIFRAAGVPAIAELINGAYFNSSREADGRLPSLAILLRRPGASVSLENELALKGFLIEANGFVPYLDRPEVHFLRTLVAWGCHDLSTLSHVDLDVVQQALGEFTGLSGHRILRGVKFGSLAALKDGLLGDPVGFMEQQEARSDTRPALYRSDPRSISSIRKFLSLLMEDASTARLADIVESSGFRHLARRAFIFDERVDDAVAAMLEFARSAARFESYGAWLQQMAKREFGARDKRRSDRKVLRMYTVHAAKGLEFDHVVIPDVEAQSFDGRGQEERNLFYVAASRARKRLTMTFRSQPSSFLRPFGRETDWAEVFG